MKLLPVHLAAASTRGGETGAHVREAAAADAERGRPGDLAKQIVKLDAQPLIIRGHIWRCEAKVLQAIVAEGEAGDGTPRGQCLGHRIESLRLADARGQRLHIDEVTDRLAAIRADEARGNATAIDEQSGGIAAATTGGGLLRAGFRAVV